MIVAVMILMIVGLLSAVAVSTSSDTNLFTRRDANYKSGLQAAEAGLQVALYRLNYLGPSSTQCVGDAVAAPDSTGWCASSVYTLGNGATYRYYTTPVLNTTGTCAGLPLSSSDVVQRCVTAVGVSNGVQARSQVRTGAFEATPLFQVPGVTGINGVSLSGSAAIAGTAGSNAIISMSGGASTSGITLGPSGTFNNSSSSHPPVTRLPGPIVLAPVNTGTSATSNDDGRITNGLQTPPVSPFDLSSPSSAVTFDASTRTLTVGGKGTVLTLGGGIYNFCQVTANGGAKISVAQGATTEIYIDSPDNPGSGCPSGTGNLTFSGGSTFSNPNSNPLALQIFVYGLSNGSGTITLSGASTIYGTLYAPQSQVTLSGGSQMIGGIVGRTVTLSGASLNWDARAGTLQATPTGTYYRTAWSQCSSAYSASAPGAGC
jgi:hypothetical protein